MSIGKRTQQLFDELGPNPRGHWPREQGTREESRPNVELQQLVQVSIGDDLTD